MTLGAAAAHRDVVRRLRRGGAGQRWWRRLRLAQARSPRPLPARVLDAYGQRCAVTHEHSLPVLEAAHIRPSAAGRVHELPSGLPLRRDLHRLFDLGYVSIRPDLRFAVSRRLREDYANGRSYYALDGKAIGLPDDPAARPDPALLAWHEAEIYLAR